MTKKNTKRKRIPVPAETQRKLLLECGFKCSMPLCENTHGLEFHHINGDARDNREDNVLVLCAVHHSMTGKRGTKLDRKACRLLKQTIQTLAVPSTIDKATLQTKWEAVIDPIASATDRAAAFESFLANLLPGFIVVETRVRSRFGEIDIVLRNESADPFLTRLADHILVECKVRQAPTDAAEVQALLGRLALQHSRTGFLFSTSGFTHQAVAAAGEGNRASLSVVLFGPDEISDMIHADDRVEVLRNSVTQSILA